MKFKWIIIAAIVMLTQIPTWAQNARFLKSGEITYEKRVNVFALLNILIKHRDRDDIFLEKMVESYKNNQKQFVSMPAKLVFNDNASLFQMIEVQNATTINNYLLNSMGAITFQKNVVYQNFKEKSIIAKKNILDQDMIIRESLRNIKWKLTDETREIAGYTCRRANGLVLDSVYVVAFYTDQIIPSGGPESFHGLPGMILGLALPHYHVTWFANKVLDRDVAPKELTPPTKGKATTHKEMHDLLYKRMENWESKEVLNIIMVGLEI